MLAALEGRKTCPEAMHTHLCFLQMTTVTVTRPKCVQCVTNLSETTCCNLDSASAAAHVVLPRQFCCPHRCLLGLRGGVCD